MDRVVINYNGRSLMIGEVVRDSTGDIWAVDVEIADSGLRASLTIALYFGDFAGFFAGLERDWRGWDGDRVHESLEGELRITARHLGGRIQLVVDLGGMMPNQWQAQVTLTMDAGEQLRAAADDLAALLSSTPP